MKKIIHMLFGAKHGRTKCGAYAYFTKVSAAWEDVTCNDCRRVGHLKLVK